ncbi:unnamed protein product [Durusdinium trenchii]|uniref:BTB domain-containing protein n=2 Tax=Durusdinium trenchii TaxID=1381693 RepID=A0ABP0J533_9DINO
MKVDTSGHSAISYVQAWLQRLDDGDYDFREQLSVELSCLTKVLCCFASTVPSAEHARVSVHEGIVELWEKYLVANTSHDLTIEATDGVVTAHAQMLKGASAVISAMLASPMKEGQAQRIQVKDVPKCAVSLFLEILYTCSTQNEPGYKTTLQALDIAHRWQVDVVVTILGDLLQGMITDANFSEIAEQAVLKARA